MTGRALLPFVVDGGDAALRLLDRLPAALDGSGPALAPLAPGGAPPPVDRLGSDGAEPLDDPADPTAVAVATSGSGGPARLVLLPASALLTSAGAGHDRLGGPGRWLLALPAQHVAGINVLVRSLVADRAPVVLDTAQTFTPERFADACDRLTGPRRYTALVPTQLVRLLDAGGAGLTALAGLDAVLVGGAAAPAPLLHRARSAGVRVVTSYGMSETCGGCVYDGVPLDGVDVDAAPGTGRVRIAGPVLARGHLAADDAATRSRPGGFTRDETGRRWFVTDDAGHWTVDGPQRRLVVTGRLDDAVTTGGVTVSTLAVEEALTAVSGIGEAVVVGVADREWGQRVVAVVVPSAGAAPPDVAGLRDQVGRRLGRAAVPTEIRVLAALPLRGPGKPDRAAVGALFQER